MIKWYISLSCLLPPLIWNSFSVFSFMTLIFLKSISQVLYVACLSVWVYPIFPQDLHFFQKWYSSHYILQGDTQLCISNCPIAGDVKFDHLVRIVSISFVNLKLIKRTLWGEFLRLCEGPVSHQIVTSLSLFTPVAWISYFCSGCQMVNSSLLMLWLIFCEEKQSLLHSFICLFIYINVDSWIPPLFS